MKNGAILLGVVFGLVLMGAGCSKGEQSTPAAGWLPDMPTRAEMEGAFGIGFPENARFVELTEGETTRGVVQTTTSIDEYQGSLENELQGAGWAMDGKWKEKVEDEENDRVMRSAEYKKDAAVMKIVLRELGDRTQIELEL